MVAVFGAKPKTAPFLDSTQVYESGATKNSPISYQVSSPITDAATLVFGNLAQLMYFRGPGLAGFTALAQKGWNIEVILLFHGSPHRLLDRRQVWNLACRR
jgi:hypothetical protein